MHAGACLTVDLAAIDWNYRFLADQTGLRVRCGGVVKADAYGLGARRVAPVLYKAGCRDFFVAHFDEGLDLQAVLPPDTSIVVLNGLPIGAEADCAEAGLLPVLNSLEQIDAWSACAREFGRPLGAVVQVDSGMSRLGLSPHEVAELAAAGPSRMNGIDVRLLMSHLACADSAGHEANAQQLGVFRSLALSFGQVPKSLANSSGIFLGDEFHHDVVRPGAALYGINPTPWQANPMRPVVRLSAQVIQLRAIEAGDHVGYGWSYRSDRPARLATLSIGYADGLHRVLGQGGVVYAEGRALRIVGRVSMDSIIIDLGDLAPHTLTRGSAIELIGPHQSLDDIAAACGTIGYEVLTGLGHRYKRLYQHAADRPRHVEPVGDILQ